MAQHLRVDLARKVHGKRTAELLRRCRSLLGSYSLRFFDGARNDKILNLQLELFDLAEHLLALAAEEHLLQLL